MFEDLSDRALGDERLHIDLRHLKVQSNAWGDEKISKYR